MIPVPPRSACRSAAVGDALPPSFRPRQNATTAERHFWGDRIINLLTIWPLATVIVRPTLEIVLTYLAICMWHTVVHSSVGFSFGKWSWLLNSPGYHRRHHGGAAAFQQQLRGSVSHPPRRDRCLSEARAGREDSGLGLHAERFGDLLTWPLRRRLPQVTDSSLAFA